MKVGDLVKVRSDKHRTIGIVVNVDNGKLVYTDIKIRLPNGVIHYYHSSQLLVLNKTET